MRLLAFLLSVPLLVGCATITKGTSQTVAIDTPGVSGAECVVMTTMGPQTVRTPGTIVVQKSSAVLPIQCKRACYHDGQGVLSSSVEAMTAGNLVVGGVVGIGVDAISGAMHNYPSQVQVVMVPVPGCGAPLIAPKRKG